jgi:hypothetical protein
MSNEILQFAETSTGTNLLTQAEYEADAQRLVGNQPGIARSKLVNKAIRQSAFVSSALAEFVSTKLGEDVLDNGDRAALVTQMENALRFSPALFTKTSSYTLLATDDTILADGSGGAFTLTLPSPAGNAGKMYFLKRIGSTPANLITISGDIDGVSGTTLTEIGEVLVIQSDGTTYQTIDRYSSSGQVVQIKYAEVLTSGTGTTVMFWDDTIPQNTEGNEIVTCSIKPKFADSILLIEAEIFGIENSNVSSSTVMAAIFRDSVADAIGAKGITYMNSGEIGASSIDGGIINFKAKTVSGSTATTTFKLRAGLAGSGSSAAFRWNGGVGARRLGGVMSTNIKITEIRP